MGTIVTTESGWGLYTQQMSSVVIMHATNNPDCPGQTESIPCNSVEVAMAWKNLYLEAGWTEVVCFRRHIETELPAKANAK